MPAQTTPRNLRGDARIDLDGQLDDLLDIRQALDDYNAAGQRLRARVQRRLASANRARIQAVSSLDEAQRIEDAPWDGKRDRRTSDRRRTAMPVALAAAEIAATASLGRAA